MIARWDADSPSSARNPPTGTCVSLGIEPFGQVLTGDRVEIAVEPEPTEERARHVQGVGGVVRARVHPVVPTHRRFSDGSPVREQDLRLPNREGHNLGHQLLLVLGETSSPPPPEPASHRRPEATSTCGHAPSWRPMRTRALARPWDSSVRAANHDSTCPVQGRDRTRNARQLSRHLTHRLAHPEHPSSTSPLVTAQREGIPVSMPFAPPSP